MEILSDFGINPTSLIAQIVNFLILLFILKKILFKPLMKVLEERKQKIATSLQEAQQIEIELKKVQEKSRELLAQADTKADQIIAEAKAAAQELKNETITETKVEAEKILNRNQSQLTLEQEKMRAALRSEMMDLVIITTEKIIGKTLSSKEKEDLTRQSIKELN